MKERAKGICGYIREMASRPEGFSTRGGAGDYSAHSLGNNACSLINHGELISIGLGALRRLFVHREHADAYQASLPERQAARREYRAKKEAERAKRDRSKVRAEKAANPIASSRKLKKLDGDNAPVKVAHYGRTPWGTDTPAIIPDGVRVQRLAGAPPCDLRYSVPPGEAVRGEFSAIPYGATLEADK